MNIEVEETNIFLSKQAESYDEDDYDDTDDVWDDTQLIKAYDKAISKAKQQILTKIQNEMGLSETDVKDVLSGDVSSPRKKKKKNKGSKDISLWKVGSACRAIFSEDGEEYEAEIIKMIGEDRCIVRYYGYNNEEETLLRRLLPSLGKNVIKLQISTAQCYMDTIELEAEKIGEQVKYSECEENGIASEPEETNQTRTDSHKQKPPFYPQRVPYMQPLPPPPPMFPGACNGFMGSAPGPSVSHHKTNQVDLNAMLQAWYMCGYYTGYYQRDLQDHQ